MTNNENAKKLRDLINKVAKSKVAYNLAEEDNPTLVEKWISTGSHYLDLIIADRNNCPNQPAGIPLGRIVEIAGLESAGKSYMALQIAIRAQQMGITPIWFDAEFQISTEFMIRMGVDLDNFVYVVADSFESVFKQVESILGSMNVPVLFILDSVAACPTSDMIKREDPNKGIGEKARLLSGYLSKLVTPLGKHGSTLLLLNQLKTRIPGQYEKNVGSITTEDLVPPGGKATLYFASLILYLKKPSGNKYKFIDEDGEQIGARVVAEVKKSRFGTEGRECEFDITWSGNEIKVQDELSWMEVVKRSNKLKQGGAWYTLTLEDGSEVKFQAKDWMEKLQETNFRDSVKRIMEEVLVKG